MQEYYNILNLPENASKAEIKAAYHHMALKFHPDVCKLEDAKERFIELTYAYQSILKHLEYEEIKRQRKFSDTIPVEEIINQWKAQERERVRKRAQQYANMPFQQFRKSDLYRSSYIFPKILAIFSLCFGLSIVFGAVYGTLNQFDCDPRLKSNFNYVASSIIVFMVGVAITSFAVSRLLPFLRKN